MGREITVVGGGIAGLMAAITCAEQGAAVTLHEAHRELGGRGRATEGPYVAHEGPHVFYADGEHWTWLADRGLTGRVGAPPARALLHAGLRYRGRIGRTVPAGFLRMILHRRRPAPVDRDFFGWASEHYGEQAARAAANAISVATYDADTGRLSAAFVWELLHRIFAPKPPAVRWVIGGWQAVIDRLGDRARELGVHIELGSRVQELDGRPTIVATELSSARALLDDPSLHWESGHSENLDLAVQADRRRDWFLAFDFDEGALHECYSAQDPTVAPEGESLFQLNIPVRAGESTQEARDRLRAFADLTVPGWRDRVRWQRSTTARSRGGAIDLPGTTWRDRPRIERGDDVWLAGDMVAAPGMRGEIAMNSAVRAARGALATVGVRSV